MLIFGLSNFVTDATHPWAWAGPALYVRGFAIHLWFSMLLWLDRVSWQTLLINNSVTVVFVLHEISFS